jgi:PAS domain S-box-containing protein
MPREIRSGVLRYVIAVGTFALLVGLTIGVAHFTGLSLDLTSLIIVVMIAVAWFLGRGPGIVYALIFEAMLDYFSTGPFTFKSGVIVFNRLVLFFSLVIFASARRKVEARLREQEEWLRVTLAGIGDAVIATNIEGIINFINPAAEQITGRSAHESVGKPLAEIFRVYNEKTGEAAEGPHAKIIRDGLTVSLANHTILLARNGREIPIEDSGAPIRDSGGSIIGTVIVFHDVTERRRAARERERLLESEKGARAHAEEAGRLRDEFLSTVSHELRTPLNAILGWSSMLLKGDMLKDETVRNAVEVIERNGKAQAMIVGDILDASRMVTGRLSVEQQNTDLAPLIKETMESLTPAAKAKSLSVTMSGAPAETTVCGDPERLRQIFWNLISNAVKFTPEGGRIRVSIRNPAGSHVEVEVEDSGRGVDPEILPFVFDRFRQADASATRAHGGLGLGLSIVRHLVELHGGTVTAASAGPGRGSRFTVAIPLAAKPSSASATIASAKNQNVVRRAGVADFDLDGLRVLIVDDDPDSLEVLSVMLGHYGAYVYAASSVAEALIAFPRCKPDVLISDLGMPGEDGYSLIRKVRAFSPENGGRIPAAALTAYVRREDREQALSAGFHTHISKPVEPAVLAEAVAGLARIITKN